MKPKQHPSDHRNTLPSAALRLSKWTFFFPPKIWRPFYNCAVSLRAVRTPVREQNKPSSSFAFVATNLFT